MFVSFDMFSNLIVEDVGGECCPIREHNMSRIAILAEVVSVLPPASDTDYKMRLFRV